MLVDAILVLMLLLAGVVLGLLVGSVLWRRKQAPDRPRLTTTAERMSAAALTARRPAPARPEVAPTTAPPSDFDAAATTTETAPAAPPGVDTDEIAPWDLSGSTADRGVWKSASGSSPVMYQTIDAYGTIVGCSAAQARLLGRAMDQLVGHSLFDLVHPEDERVLREHLDLARQSREEARGTVRLMHVNGHPLEMAIHSKPLFDRADNFVGSRSLLKDMTSRRQREELLERALQALAEKNAILALKTQEIMRINRNRSEFISSVSHELRTPLHAVIGYAELLGRGLYGSLTDRQKKAVDGIVNRGNDLLNLINNILDLSRIEMGRLQLELTMFDPVEVLQEVIQTAHLLQRQADEAMADEDGWDDLEEEEEEEDGAPVAIRTNFGDAPSEVSGDRNRFQQVVLNMVSNALRYTEVGHVDVICRREPDGTFVVAVSDTGVGIAPEDQEAIFEAFYQVEASSTRIHGGTGLGLPIARKLTEQMGGRLTVLSRLGVGSTFYLRLPEVGPTPAEKSFELATVTGLHLPHRQAATILVVGQEGEGYLGIKEGLREEGLDLYEAPHAREGYELARGRLPTAIVHLLSGENDNPADLISMVRGDPLSAHIPVVVVGPPQLSAALTELQVDDFVSVPTDGVEVAERVWPLIGRRQERVLLVGPQAESLNDVAEAIRARGFSVARAQRGARAVDFLQRSPVQMAVVANDIPDIQVTDLLAAVEQMEPDERPAVVVVLRQAVGPEARTDLRSRAMALLDPGELSPEEMAQRILELLTPLDDGDGGMSETLGAAGPPAGSA